MGRRRGGHASGGHSSSERWLLTYADLITLLLIYFIVLFAMSQIDTTKYKKMADAMSNAFNVIPSAGGAADSVLPPGSKLVMPPIAPMHSEEEAAYRQVEKAVEDVAKQLKATASFDVHEEKRGLVISIADTALFGGGTADLNPNMQRALDQIANSVRNMPNRIHIEGHTDDLPIKTGRFPSNWELSTARATNVLRYLQERKGLPPSRLAAAGYGEHYPRVPNASPDSRAKNRRVDIVILREATSAKQEPAQPGTLGSEPQQGASDHGH
ncbi:MAG: OmpA family protein [Candidatus Sericytochromatia bacterium]|nr:OmpA family protein [Candidatus Tanganyikabacteria bacterium]